MNRVRWLNVKWPGSMWAIGQKMKDLDFSEDSADGFVIERIRDNFIEGRFVERYTYQEIIITPSMKEEVIDRTGYRLTDFTLSSSPSYIEIKNEPRSIKGFLNRLIEICSFNITISPIKIDLLIWLERFRDEIDGDLFVDSLQVSGIDFESGVSGKLLLKGTKDVRNTLIDILRNKKYDLEKIQVKIKLPNKKASIHLTSNGSVKIPPDYTIELLPVLRDALFNQDFDRRA